MLAATRDMPVRPLPSGPAPSDAVSSDIGDTSALDRLLGWLTGTDTPPSDEAFTGPAPHN